MTNKNAVRALALTLVPLAFLGSLGPATVADAEASAALRASGATLQLATLKAEARTMTVHIDGP